MRSIQHAMHGIAEMLKSEHNAWIHLFATILTIFSAYYFKLKTNEWCFLILAIISVWVSEALNTAFEFLCDVASPEFHPLVKKSKDVAAGAVLLSAIGAITIALVIFLPYVASNW
jgi:Diacylglycerol kinase